MYSSISVNFTVCKPLSTTILSDKNKSASVCLSVCLSLSLSLFVLYVESREASGAAEVEPWFVSDVTLVRPKGGLAKTSPKLW